MVRYQQQPDDFRTRLEGRTITRIRRHGKFLVTELEGDMFWVTHLGMSGRVQMVRPEHEVAPHTNVTVDLDIAEQFRLVDPRTFGFVVAYTAEELADSALGNLGPDALTDLPRLDALLHLFSGRTSPIKPLLLDQSIVAGIGNIYADEALFRSGISPFRSAGSLDRDDVKRLRAAIKVTLSQALRWGGTTLDDMNYRLPDGRTGEYMSRLSVYGNSGEPCPRCGTEVVSDTLRQRTTHWCPTCQR